MGLLIGNKYWTPGKTYHSDGVDISAKEVVLISKKEERVLNYRYGWESAPIFLVSLSVNDTREYHELVNADFFENKEDCVKYITETSLENLANIQLIIKKV